MAKKKRVFRKVRSEDEFFQHLDENVVRGVTWSVTTTAKGVWRGGQWLAGKVKARQQGGGNNG